MVNKCHYIHTGRDGTLGETDETDVRNLVRGLADTPRVVLHIHGGLVNRQQALAKAGELLPFYMESGIYPVFIVWETGMLETIRNNLGEIDREPLYSALLHKLLQWVLGLGRGTESARSTGPLLPSDFEVQDALAARQDQRVPFVDAPPFDSLPLMSKKLSSAFEADLRADVRYQAVSREFLRSGNLDRVAPGLSPEIREQLRAEPGARGVLDGFSLTRTVAVLTRVLRRLAAGRGHGMYATVVEELLHELYLAKAGRTIWEWIKRDSAQTFQKAEGQEARGGWLLVDLLGELLREHRRLPRLSIVAHSAGSVYACNMLRYLFEARERLVDPIAGELVIRDLIFLAPACDFKLFAEVLTLQERASLFEQIRLFALGDELEAGYWEIPGLYPRSLLYLVSGICEAESDTPLLGMERFHRREEVYQGPEIEQVRQYFADVGNSRPIWSEDDRGPGRKSDAQRHSELDDVEPRRATMESVRTILCEGHRG